MTNSKDPKAHILLVDDHPAVRRGLSQLLKSLDHEVTGEAGNLAEAQTVIQSGSFQLAILDLSLDDGNGYEFLLTTSGKGVPSLIYSMHEDPETISRAMSMGARGYVTKREEPEVLLDGVEAVLRGERFFSPLATQSLNKSNKNEKYSMFLLSDREREIFIATGRGISKVEIAKQLNISPRTVETYLARIINKLGLKNIPTLRKLAISMGTDCQINSNG